MPIHNQETQLRSEHVQDILNYVPNWMIRWGMTLVLSILLGLLFISWFVKYPDIIITEVVVTTSVPPEKVYANSNGQLEVLLVNDNDLVREHEILAVIENNANYKDVILLKSILDTISINSKSFSFPIESVPILMLGDIAENYAVFENFYTDYVLNKSLNPYSNEFTANKLSVSQANHRIDILILQQELNTKEMAIKKKDLERQKELFIKGIISEQAFELEQLVWLQTEKNAQSLNSQISQLKENLGNSKKTLKGTEIRKTLEETRLYKNLIQSFFQLNKAVKDWELRYVLKSSINGKVSFLSYWDKNQTINLRDNVFTIIPTDRGNYLAKIKAPAQNSGKIKLKQQVNIRLENYPSNEFGMLIGVIENISLVPNNEGYYLIDVSLEESLRTTFDQTIVFKQEMTGVAEIVTQDLRLIERFFYQIKDIFKR